MVAQLVDIVKPFIIVKTIGHFRCILSGKCYVNYFLILKNDLKKINSLLSPFPLPVLHSVPFFQKYTLSGSQQAWTTFE